jgi:hypothetical protein
MLSIVCSAFTPTYPRRVSGIQQKNYPGEEVGFASASSPFVLFRPFM